MNDDSGEKEEHENVITLEDEEDTGSDFEHLANFLIDLSLLFI